MDASPTAPARRVGLAPTLGVLLARVEGTFDRAFGQPANPWRHLGGLAFFLFWVVAATGIYVYIGFDTRADGAWTSVERMSANVFPAGSLARSLHRYASDALVLTATLHLLREWTRGHYAHFRRFSWLTGVATVWLLFASGIGGFWLVWDRLAQYSLIATAEWLDALPMFDGALVRNFIATGAVNDRLFSLLIFLHIGLPLALLATMWMHLQRLSRPASSPPRSLAWGTLGALTLLSLLRPVVSDAPADLAVAPGVLALDWFYLVPHAIADRTSQTVLWALAAGFTLWLLALPFVSRAARMPRPAPAVVELANCNGCARCFADCPYAAVTMQPRTDGRPHRRQATVDGALCAGCGICAGACPSSTPFRSVADLVTGIDMPHSSIHVLRRELDAALARIREPIAGTVAPSIVAFGCRPESGGADLAAIADVRTAALPLLCAAQLPPSFIEYALRAGADGVLVTGCRDGDCAFRLGNRWTRERLAVVREPHLRASAPPERVRVVWAGRHDTRALIAATEAFRADLSSRGAGLPAGATPPKRSRANHAGTQSR